MLFLLLLALVPFALAQLLPSQRAVIITLALLSAFTGLMYYQEHMPRENDLGDGPGAVIGMIMFYMFKLGSFTGLLTKLLTLWMSKKDISLPNRNLVRLSGLIVLILLAVSS